MSSITGLTTLEVSKRLKQYGRNEIQQARKTTYVELFLHQFQSVLVLLLIGASLISLLLGETLDGLFIILIVLLNAVLGFIQEYKADQAIDKLKDLTAAYVRLIRDGIETRIDSRELVPGDVILLEAGDRVPADVKLLEGLHCEVDESILTGESMPVEKRLKEDNENTLFLGTTIVKGRCTALVTNTGMQTKFGNIARDLMSIKEEKTPLQKQLDKLGSQLGLLAVGASSVVFIISLIYKQPLLEVILTSISLSVAAVPEGLPAVVTITLALGMQRMARGKAILRKLTAIETLGSATVIATDKTGTLTTGKMKVTDIWFDDAQKDINKLDTDTSETLELLYKVAVNCNNASLIFKHDHGDLDSLGDPTEGALLMFIHHQKIDVEKMKQKGEIKEEFAFDANLKLMTVIKHEDNGIFVLTKGAPETVLERCEKIMIHGKSEMLDERLRDQISKAVEKQAGLGKRLIAFGYKKIDEVTHERERAEERLVFLGFVGISDPPRSEVKEAIASSERAGIRTIMITGDNQLTANAIGTHVGLIKTGDDIITGDQLDAYKDDELIKKLPSIRIFARSIPQHKLRIVQLLQKTGAIVAVTGDGVNDALALKQADVGVAMGSGTDVAKEAADMVVTDDNYATLVKAIEEGRSIFDNIKHAIQYLIGCNIAEVIAVTVSILLGWPLIYTPLQLLYINLVTDGLPAIALAIGSRHPHLMLQKPRKRHTVFNQRDIWWFIEVSSLSAVLGLATFYMGLRGGDLYLARTLSFTTIILTQYMIFIDIWLRDRSLLRQKIRFNPLVIAAIVLPVCLQLLLIYHSGIAEIFKIKSISLWHLTLVFSLSASLVLVAETRKIFRRNKLI